MLPLRSADIFPPALTFSVSGRSETKEPSSASSLPSMPIEGSSPRRSVSLPFVLTSRPSAASLRFFMSILILSSSSVLASPVRAILMLSAMSLCDISESGTSSSMLNEGIRPFPSSPLQLPVKDMTASVLTFPASGTMFSRKPSMASWTLQLSIRKFPSMPVWPPVLRSLPSSSTGISAISIRQPLISRAGTVSLGNDAEPCMLTGMFILPKERVAMAASAFAWMSRCL